MEKVLNALEETQSNVHRLIAIVGKLTDRIDKLEDEIVKLKKKNEKTNQGSV